MIGRTNTGGGGGGLNFIVVGGTSEPSNPKENTIWVNTDTQITNWEFSPTEPTGAEGMVWIQTGTSSSKPFNALKKNNITICPMSAKQYIGGTWVSKTIEIYQGGVWCSFVLYVYKDGELSQISGFTMTGGTVTDADGVLTFKTSSYTASYLLAHSTEKIDFAGMGTLTVNFLADSYSYRGSNITGATVGFGITQETPSVTTKEFSTGIQPLMSNAVAWYAFAHTANNGASPEGELTLDVSAVTASGYLCFLGRPFDSSQYGRYHCELYVDLIKFE